jgi:DNA-binding MarR family transcriptional regulator
VERHLDRSATSLMALVLEVDMLAEQVASKFDINGRDIRAVSHVAFAGPLSASRLADRLQVSTGAMTGILRRLQQGGWLEIDSDPQDGRRLIVSRSARTEELLRRWLSMVTDELGKVHPNVPHPTFPHDLTAASTIVQRHRELLERMGPAELRALGELAEVAVRQGRT